MRLDQRGHMPAFIERPSPCALIAERFAGHSATKRHKMHRNRDHLYTDSGCCRLSTGKAARWRVGAGALSAGALSMTARSSASRLAGTALVVAWTRALATPRTNCCGAEVLPGLTAFPF